MSRQALTPTQRRALWKALDDIAELGYRYAVEQIAGWQHGKSAAGG